MTEIEDSIIDYVIDNGLSSSSVQLIQENISNISSTFLTDILVENTISLIGNNLFLEFLPHIWKDDNTSNNVLTYISGILHKLLYLAREQPLGKDISDYYKKELDYFHKKLCDFQSECLDAIEILEHFQIKSVESFADLISTLDYLPTMTTEISEMLRIIAVLFIQFARDKNKQIRNLDELCVFLSRCLILWKLKIFSNPEFEICLKNVVKKYSQSIKLDKFEEILSLELQNYQFLQFGINHQILKFFIETFTKIYEKEKSI